MLYTVLAHLIWDSTVSANPNPSHSFVSSLALRQIGPSSSTTNVSVGAPSVQPHLPSLAWPSSAMQLATISKKYRTSAIVPQTTASVQRHFFRPKETVYYVTLVRLMKGPWFNCF